MCSRICITFQQVFKDVFKDLYNISTGVYIDLLVMTLKMRLSRISTFFSSELEAVPHDMIPYLIRE